MSTQNKMQSLSDPSEDEVFYGPDSELVLTFGSVSKASVPVLISDPVDRPKIIDGTGRFAEPIRKPRTVTNKEMYDYLRLGVSSQCAVAFKALGYETPEDLLRTEKISVRLPDILYRDDREYPLEFIDQCEKEGISALDCQTVLRRGMLDAHMNNTSLTLRQLVSVFRTHVKRGGAPALGPNDPKHVVNYLMDGTIPFEVIDNPGYTDYSAAGNLFKAARELTEEKNRDLLARLQAEPLVFRKIISKLSMVKDRGAVRDLTDRMDQYGSQILELSNPYICGYTYKADGEKHVVSYEDALYAEELITSINGHYGMWSFMVERDSGIRLGQKIFNFSIIHKLRVAGFKADEVETLVINSETDPEAVLAAREEGIETSLLSGAL